MKRNLLLLLALKFSFVVNAQINFEKGYFISNDNEKIECLIKSIDWKNNPTEFKYKLNEKQTCQKIDY